MRLFFLFLFLFLCLKAYSQNEWDSVSALTEDVPEEGQLYSAEEKVQQDTRLNLNKATSLELLATQLLCLEQVNDILQHRQQVGLFMSVYELQSIASISLDTLLLLSCILHVPQPMGRHSSLSAILEEGTHYQLFRWERKTMQSKGYLSDSKGNVPYAGPDYRLLYRFRSSSSKLYHLGLSLEKDPGEEMVWSPKQRRYGFDYLSGYLILYPEKFIRQITLGDFHFRSGHGLVFGGNFFQSRNPEYWQSNWQLGTGFRPHSSSSEYGFYRGGGISLHKKRWEGNWFYSNTPQDGTLQNDETFSAFNTSGLHRTFSEQAKRHNTRLMNTGGSIHYHSFNKQWQIGLHYLLHQFSYPFMPSITYYNRQVFRGNTHQIAGGFIQHNYTSGVVFMETAFSSQQGKALYGGIIHNLSGQHTFITQVWSANASFQSFQGNIPAYSSKIANESGIYQALLIQCSPRCRLSSGWTVYTHPQVSFNKKGPSYGSEWINRFSYRLKKKTTAFLQLRWRTQEENFKPDSSTYSYLLPSTRYYLMIDLHHAENLHWGLHSRIQSGSLQYPVKEKAYCISQSVYYHYKQLKLTTQLSIFETHSWNSRLYAYEPDVPQAFSVPPLYGKGLRACVILTLRLLRKIELSCKISHVVYTGQKTIGSGYDEVKGNEQSEIKVQMRLFF